MYKDLFFSFTNIFGRAILGFALFPLIAEIYGMKGLGSYSLAYVWSMCLMTIVDFGYTITIPVSVSSGRVTLGVFLAQNNVSKIALLTLSWCLLGLILIFDMFPGNSSVLCAVFLYFSVGGFYHYVVLYFRGLGNYQSEAKYSLWGGAISVLSFFLLGIFGVTLAQNIFLVAIIRFGYSIFVYRHFLTKYSIDSLGFSKNPEFKSGFSAFFLTCSGVLYLYADSFLLGFYLIASDYAIYQVMIQTLIVGSLAGLALSNFVLQRASKFPDGGAGSRFFLFRMLMGSLILAAVILAAIQLSLILLNNFNWLPNNLNVEINKYSTEINLVCLLIFLRVTSSPLGAFLSGLNRTYLRVWMNVLALTSSVVCLSYIAVYNEPSIFYGLISGVVAHLVLLLVGLAICFHVTRQGTDGVIMAQNDQ